MNLMKGFTGFLLVATFLTGSAAAQTQTLEPQNLLSDLDEEQERDKPVEKKNFSIKYSKLDDSQLENLNERAEIFSAVNKGGISFKEFVNLIFRLVTRGEIGSSPGSFDSVRENSFQVTGNFSEVANVWSVGNDFFYLVESSSGQDYLFRNNTVYDKASEIEQFRAVDDKPFYKREDINSKLIYGNQTLFKTDAGNEIKGVTYKGGNPVYTVENSEGLIDVYIGRQKIYSDISNYQNMMDIGSKVPAILKYTSSNGTLKTNVIFKDEFKLGPFEVGHRERRRPGIQRSYIAKYAGVNGTICMADKPGEEFDVHCGEDKVHDSLESVEKLTSTSDELVVLAEGRADDSFGDHNKVYIGGEQVSAHPEILNTVVSSEDFYYTALTSNGLEALFRNGEKIEGFDATGKLKLSNGKPILQVRDGENWSVYYQGETYGSHKSIVGLDAMSGKPVYIGVGTDKSRLMHGEKVLKNLKQKTVVELEATDTSVNVVTNKGAQAQVNYNGNKGVLIKGFYNELESDEIEIINGKPVYSHFKVDNLLKNAEKSDEVGKAIYEGSSLKYRTGKREVKKSMKNNKYYILNGVFIDPGNFASDKYEQINPSETSRYKEWSQTTWVNGKPVYAARYSNDDKRYGPNSIYWGEERLARNRGRIDTIKEFNNKPLHLSKTTCTSTSCTGDYNVGLGRGILFSTDESTRGVFSEYEDGISKLQKDLTNRRDAYITDIETNEEDRIALAYNTGNDYSNTKVAEDKIAWMKGEERSDLTTEIKEFGPKLTPYNMNIFKQKLIFTVQDSTYRRKNQEYSVKEKLYFDGEYSKDFDHVDETRVFDQNFVYKATKDNKTILAKNKHQKIIETSKKIKDFKEVNGKIMVLLEDGELKTSEETIANKEKIGQFKEISESLAYTFKDNNSWKLSWNGEIVDEASKITHLTEKDGKPLYLAHRDNIYEITANGQKIGQTDSKNQIFQGEGIIGYVEAKYSYSDEPSQKVSILKNS